MTMCVFKKNFTFFHLFLHTYRRSKIFFICLRFFFLHGSKKNLSEKVLIGLNKRCGIWKIAGFYKTGVNFY